MVGAPRAAIQRFIATESAGGVVLVAGAVVGLVWANSPLRDSYDSLLSTELALHLDLHAWVNDGLMALFFLVVGLEIRRELTSGELSDPRAAAAPAIAAVGGMVVPALLYLAVVGGGPGRDGWGVPMATDIAFALGVIALLGSRVPSSLKLFLLTLAIVDDIGAIVVIAVFYTADLHAGALAGAGAILLLMLGLRLTKVGWWPVYLVLGAVLWFAVHESGVHATIAGVVMAFAVPTSMAERLEHGLHPWTSFLVIPIFALANAGVELTSSALDSPGTAGVAAGIAVGLVAGKTLGVTGATWLAVRTGVGRLPEESTWLQVIGIACIAGIGFTVSLFVTELAFEPGSPLATAAKLGVLTGSCVAAVIGAVLLAQRARAATAC